MDNGSILLIHFGGLGDVCLSESVFLSLREHFGNRLLGLGNKRFLDLFGHYFLRVESVESRGRLYLFSDGLPGPQAQRIVFIGKDRDGTLRERWQRFSRDEIIFIEMYPEDASGPSSNVVHVEDYQLAQLASYGITARKKEITPRPSSHVVLYPEKGFKKNKWPPEHFFRLYDILKSKGTDAVIMEELGTPSGGEDRIFLQELSEVKAFFREKGGVFVSNDSGMAHLAGALCLSTITIFTDGDPMIWHPRGRNLFLRTGIDNIDETALLEAVLLHRQ